MSGSLFVTIQRNSDQYVTSYDVWAKMNSYPMEEGDGVFVGNVTIAPSVLTTSIAFAHPDTENWKFSALSIYRRDPGIFHALDGT